MYKCDVEAFADEIITPIDFNNKRKNILVLGTLLIKKNNKERLINDLLNLRCLNDKCYKWTLNHDDCSIKDKCKIQWHELNNCELHFQDIRSAGASRAKINIAQKWLNYIIEHNIQNKNIINLNILYIDLDILKVDHFGQEKKHENIYNRFFRTVLEYGLKSFYSNYHHVHLNKVYHDESSLEKHRFFPFLNLQKLDLKLNDKMVINNPNIHFVNSDHKKYQTQPNQLYFDSQLIQFIDIIMGTFTQNIYYSSNDDVKKRMAMEVRPLVKRLVKNPWNRKSKYNYVNRQRVSFFPKYEIDKRKYQINNLDGSLAEIDKTDQFHNNKELEMPDYNPNQKLLDKWF